jgi:hypothetical protein
VTVTAGTNDIQKIRRTALNTARKLSHNFGCGSNLINGFTLAA